VFEPLSLDALPLEDASAQLEDIEVLLGQESITAEEAVRVGMPSKILVRVQLDQKEKQAVHDFVTSGLGRLRARTESLSKKSG
jgi:enoyl-CoA hydratase/carnithine racemase